MNAVTERTRLDTEAVLELIPITAIAPSKTHIQTLRRRHFDAEKMLELAASIQANGVLQPILVRPIPPRGSLKYELVAGERRWAAADRAGLAHIPCTVRPLTDEQALEAQLVENTQRESLHVLEEAAGYDELMQLTGINAERLGDKIGKSRSYVYARLKLLDLIPAARDALANGTLDASKGLLLARIKGEKMQTCALKRITEEGAYYSYRRLVNLLRNDFMIPLAQAPWRDRDTLHLKSGEPVIACADCPSRSGNDAELCAEIGNADTCTDRGCFDLKTKLHWARLRQDYRAEGRAVLTGDEAAAVLDDGRYPREVTGGHVRLDAECDSIEFGEPAPEQAKNEPDETYEARLLAWESRIDQFHTPTYRELLGPLPESLLAEGKGGHLVEIAPVAVVAKALKAKGIAIPHNLKPARKADQDDPQETAADRERERAERAREEERKTVELEYRCRLLKAIHAKWKPPLKKHDLEYIAEAMLEGAENSDAFDALYPGRIDPAKLKEAELQRFMVIYAINHDCDPWNLEHNSKPSALLDYAQRLKIDIKKLRADVVKDLKPVSAGEVAVKGKGVKK